jgi:hypothetical protein
MEAVGSSETLVYFTQKRSKECFYLDGRDNKFLLSGSSCLPDHISSHPTKKIITFIVVITSDFTRFLDSIISASEGGREEGRKEGRKEDVNE